MFASFQVLDLRSPSAVVRVRRAARHTLRPRPGLRYARVFGSSGSARRAGFVPGLPDPRRVCVFTLWDSAEARRASGIQRLAEGDARHAWEAGLEPFAAGGSLYGEFPFADEHRPARQRDPAARDEPVAALTIGRTTPRRAYAFARETPALADSLFASPGLVTALAAGLPLVANATFSLWQSERDMLRFAYGRDDGAHRATIGRHRERALLAEQLTARFRPLYIDGAWNPATTPGSDALRRLRDSLAG